MGGQEGMIDESAVSLQDSDCFVTEMGEKEVAPALKLCIMED
jgi:hypothetical protein